jgi:hypothetical protein
MTVDQISCRQNVLAPRVIEPNFIKLFPHHCHSGKISLFLKISVWGAQKLTGENLKLIWGEFSTIS